MIFAVSSLDWNVVGAGISAFSIGLAIYFYSRSSKTPIPTYAVHPLRVRLVDKTQMTAPGLQVLHNGQPLGARNVTAATVYFWNDGRAPIRRGAVLKPYAIDLDESAQLLESQTVNVTRDVCGFQIFPEANGHQVALNFEIIEPQDGVEIQIIYAGDPNALIRVRGICEGSNEPKRREQVTTTAYEAAGAIISAGATFILGGVFLFAAGVFVKPMFKPMPGGLYLVGSDSNPWVVLLLLVPLAVGVSGIVYIYRAVRKLHKFTSFRNSAIEQLTKKSLAPTHGS
jgi:hypothetical protein